MKKTKSTEVHWPIAIKMYLVRHQDGDLVAEADGERLLLPVGLLPFPEGGDKGVFVAQASRHGEGCVHAAENRAIKH